jgi:hypothetical protein
MNRYHEFCTCVAMQFDWSKAIDNEQIPLRAFDKPDAKAKQKDKTKPFSLPVDPTHTGAVAKAIPFGFDVLKPAPLTKGMLGSMTGYGAVKDFHRKDWIPVGTRMTAFVDKNAVRDADAVDSAMTLMPAANENATIMIYRTRGKKDSPLRRSSP